MGNGITKNPCFSGNPYAAAPAASDTAPEDSHGHSFTYLPMAAAFDRTTTAGAGAMPSETSFFSLSGAAISANVATSASIPSFRLLNEQTWPPLSGGTFESSRSFASVPLLQAAPPRLSMSGPLLSVSSGRFSDTSAGGTGTTASTASDRFSDRPFVSGGTLDSSLSSSSFAGQHQPSVSRLIAERRAARSRRRDERSLFQYLASVASRLPGFRRPTGPRREMESLSEGGYRWPNNGNVQWAQGVVGEDRFHVAVSEEHGWVFVGIYDGFSGPDAADYLFSNLYVAVHRELKGVLWDDIQVGQPADILCSVDDGSAPEAVERKAKKGRTDNADANASASTSFAATAMAMHRSVLQALARALRKTEDAFFEAAEENAEENPEVGLMGSCVLVMLMKGTDVYVMNVGDSRAVLAARREPDLENILGKASQDLKHFKQEIMRELQAQDRDGLQSVQLTPEHSTAVEEEVRRIRSQHLNDREAIDKGRVKGKLNVTRAFGAGFLKDPKWNARLIKRFQIRYVGTDPYISCIPSLCHHRIGSNDKFLVLSSDGLYQYFTNKEVVDQVEMFTAEHPEGDPAHHLVGELVQRAARKHGMDYCTLLGIPRGNRREYHDDVSVIVISFEGRIWRSSV